MAEEFIFDSDDFITFCHDFDTTLIEDLTDSLLEVTLQDLSNRWANVQKSYRSLCLNTDENIKPELKQSAKGKFAACTKVFHSCKSKILDGQKSLIVPQPSVPREFLTDIPMTGNISSCIQVPPCDTEIFYGGYEEWPSFRDMFTAVYVEHPKLSAVQKLYHLRLKVRGQAAGIVKKYKLCGENFSLAWEALNSRYENKRILVDNQLKILLNLKPLVLESSEGIQEIQSTINDCLAALEAQNISVTNWDPIVVYLCSTKLPHGTLSLWEQSLKSHRDLPKWTEMDTFLSNRYEVVERLDSIQGTKQEQKKKTYLDTNSFNTQAPLVHSPCKLCNMNHPLRKCPEFNNLSPRSRNEFVSQNKICLNCLSYSHLRGDCTSKFVCSICKRNHHSLLHFFKSNTSPGVSSPNTMSPIDDQGMVNSAQSVRNEQNFHSTQMPQTLSHFTSYEGNSGLENTLLPTAVVHISHMGDLFAARAFLDQGSERTFISKSLQQRLMLSTESKRFQIRGIGGHILANTNSICELNLFSKRHDQYIKVHAIVVPKITRLLPNFFVSKTECSLNELESLDLADTEFHSPGQVDLLIGSNILPCILLEGTKRVGNSLIAQATIFGWIISGPVASQTVSTFSLQAAENSDDNIGKQLRLFWEQEEVQSNSQISPEDEYCESLFVKTTYRDSDGRYVVKLPFKSSFLQTLTLGSTRSQAFVQYLRMEQTLKKKPEIDNAYRNVLQEYITLNHMEPTDSRELGTWNSHKSFYLPHHAVLRPDSLTTKVRVVFNASKRTNTGNSLNDVLHIGPRLQLDLMTLILKWRLHKYVFSGDIEKMYRQILVHKDDISYQRILFRPEPSSPISDFTLKTLTFGVNCAPYLAIRTLIKLAEDSVDKYPKASQIIQNETYVDDILSGSNDLQSCIEALTQVIAMLQSAGFPLRKITTNCPEILRTVPESHTLGSEFLKFYETSDTKTLGIQWNALSDCFSYKIEPIQQFTSITKRRILSIISKLFDPAGWLSPIIVQGKMFFQHLWIEGFKWDENVNVNTLHRWNNYIATLSKISNIKIPRWVNYEPHFLTQIHGFCDASEKAYCAVIYIRMQDDKSTHVHILAAKTKIAPIAPFSLPRLELCGAVLLSRLINQLLSSLTIEQYETFLWCDSSIVLGWLKKPPATWKTFVANRTAEIIRNVGNITWRHIRSSDNPADLGSRGCNSEDLIDNSLWWHGPMWLLNHPEEWPQSLSVDDNPPEIRKVEVFSTFENDADILDRFSQWDKAIRVMAYVFRFLSGVCKKSESFSSLSISHSEFLITKNRLISLTQRRYYSHEYAYLLKSTKVSKKSTLYPLNPFLDSTSVIRASGRITNSDLIFNERHPIILPVKSQYCKLFISFTHTLLMHAEHNLMLRTIREEYYVSRLRSAIKKCIRSCKICVIYKHKIQSQIMAALPHERSTFSLPFSITGLDFAGPFSIKASLVRQATYHKGYVCVFVCFSTKSIHLELCSDLTTDSFRASFTRFVGRRGLPRKVMSDNGTNFVGAERSLRHEFKEFLKVVSEDIASKYATHGFQWSFIPPNAPHMGGLWEAGVKSFKMHFKKVAKNHKYTFEEFTTLLARIEAVLNSRPLSAMTDDPNELLALTPGHFLRGAPLVAIPEVVTEHLSLVNRWEKLKSIQHQFALRWKDEYLKDLQRRYKWQQQNDDVHVGQLVVIKDDLLPPCEWRLGRIKNIFQGTDGHVRVANIRTESGTLTRPIVKLCLLPTDKTQT